MQALPNKVNGIVIPSTVNFWEDNVKHTRKATEFEIDFNSWRVKSFLSMLCGGFTVTPQKGGWFDTTQNRIIEEDSLFIWSYGDIDEIGAQQLQICAESIAAAMVQDSVLVVINSQPYLT